MIKNQRGLFYSSVAGQDTTQLSANVLSPLKLLHMFVMLYKTEQLMFPEEKVSSLANWFIHDHIHAGWENE